MTRTGTEAQSRAMPQVFRGPSVWAVSVIHDVLTLKEVNHSMGASLGQLLHPTEVLRTKDLVALGAGRRFDSSGQGKMESTKPSSAEVSWSQMLVMWIGVETRWGPATGLVYLYTKYVL